jgi:protein-S-isoprenylcysteine O-methyltransferase Ste14
VDRRARFGILIQSVAYWVLWANPFWTRQPGNARIAGSVVFFAAGCALSFTAVRALGKQWRVDAGLSADHRLVQEGPYRLVRHPIYLSMFCMLIGSGLLGTPGWTLALSIAIFLVGAEIRVRIEDGLLQSRFGDEFRAYQRRVSAYIPWVR